MINFTISNIPEGPVVTVKDLNVTKRLDSSDHQIQGIEVSSIQDEEHNDREEHFEIKERDNEVVKVEEAAMEVEGSRNDTIISSQDDVAVTNQAWNVPKELASGHQQIQGIGITSIKDEEHNDREEHFETQEGVGNAVKEEEVTLKEDGSRADAFIVSSRKGRRYTKEFKAEVVEYLVSHSVEEAVKVFDISKVSALRWKSEKTYQVTPKLQNKSSDRQKKSKRLSLKAEIMKEKREEVLEYLKGHTYKETHKKFGISIPSIQSWKMKRNKSVEICTAVLGDLVANVERIASTEQKVKKARLAALNK